MNESIDLNNKNNNDVSSIGFISKPNKIQLLKFTLTSSNYK